MIDAAGVHRFAVSGVVRRRARSVLAALGATMLAATAYAQSTPARVLGSDEIRLYGIGLRVEPAHQTVPRDIATIVSTYLQAPALPTGLPPFAPDAVVRATLRGPSFATPRELVVSPNTPFNIPPMTVAGIHTLDSIRLESGGTVLLRGAPESVTLQVIDRLLVTQVTARALTAAEIREKGIVFDSTNFQAYNFSAAFAIEERRVELSFPVLLPQLQGAADVQASQATIPAISTPSLPSLQTIIPDTLRLQAQIPNLSVVGFTLSVPNLQGQDFQVPPIPGVIVIPGDIGFLNQFFSVMLMVGNVAPAGSNLVVDSLSAEIVLPPGYDQVVGSTDDPLAMARTTQGETARIRAVVQPGADGTLGTPDDVATIGPGESGNAEYLVEGRREGSHVVEMEISGTLHGLPIGPVQVRGRAAGAVLVRNPTFTLTFTHPEAVAAGEPYTLDVTVSNTSESPANFVSVTMYPRNVSGATVVGEPTRAIESIPPGDSATVSFDLVSRITGKVTAATLDSNENVAGRFELKTAVGELGVPVSPDSLVLPKEAASLPVGLRQAAIGLLGKAWSVATAPAAALPPSVQRFSKKIVLDRAVEVAEAGFRVTLHEPTGDSAAQLLMDFAGSQVARLPELYPLPGDRDFARTNINGFDSLRRTSVRGDTFASAVGAMLAASLQSAGPAPFHLSLAEKWIYRPRSVSLLISSAGPLPYTVTITDAQGRRLGGTGENNKVTKEIPFSDVVPIGDAVSGPSSELLLLAAPEAGAYTVTFARRPGVPAAPVTISLVLPGAADAHRQVVYELGPGETPLFTPTAEDPFQFAFTPVAEGAPARNPSSTSPVTDAPPAILGVVQMPSADQIQCSADSTPIPVGRVIAVLFSEEVTRASVQDKLQASAITNYLVGGNKVVGIALQPGGRIAFVALRDPIGIYIPRELLVSNVMDLRGQAMAPASLAIETVLDRGAVVSGRVLQADGTPVPFADVRLFYLVECNVPTWVGISAKTADSQGRYSFDFATSELRNRLVVVNPDDPQDFRSVPYTVSRNGQRLNVDIVFLGRGTFNGRTLNESGQPLANTSLRVTSLTDQSQFGVTTDPDGRFSVSRIPVGNLFVEAVNTLSRSELRTSDYIPFAGATVTRDLMLLDVVTQETTVQHGTLRGYVLRADGSTPAGDVPVIIFYEHLSQPGVSCPGNPPPGECAVAMANSGADGAFLFTDIVAGRLRAYAFDQGGLSEGSVRFTLAPDAIRESVVLLSGGLGTVHGTVLDATGAPVANASVGGGLSLSTTNALGQFTLTDVPIGRREIVAVSEALGARGSATIDLVRAGESANVTIVFSAMGSIGGVVYQPDGLTPIPNQPVYAFRKQGEGIEVVGTATTNATGGYRIDRIGIGEYSVSAVNSSLNDGNIVRARINAQDQVFRADIRFRGGNGTVQGVVLDDDGQTPLRGVVGISGDQLVVAGGRVAVEFRHVRYFRVVESDLTTGRFSVPGLFVGPFTLTAAGPFSPDPISFEGVIPSPGATVEVNLQLQSTSQIAGVVYRPDGVTPVAAGTIVRYQSDAFKVICREDAGGDEVCESIPQGIQDETVITGDDGRFWLPIVNAGQFTLVVEDVATGRTGEAKGSVRAGERAEMSVRLTGLGELTVHVRASDGVTPIPGARVRAEQVEHPRKTLTFTADANGTIQFAGGDAFSEGTVIVTATDQRNGFAGRASARIERDGQQVALNVHLFDAVGSVSGSLYRSDGLTPVEHGEIVISHAGVPLAIVLTDASGHYESPGIPLGEFQVEAFEAATSRRAAGSGRIDLANQSVPVNLTQLAIGMVKGVVLLGGPLTPLKAWTVGLNQSSAGGITRPSLQTTSGIDGSYQFPGVSQGAFGMYATRSGVSGTAVGNGTIAREGQIVDVPLIANIVRPLYGRIQGLVLTPTGQAASFSDVQLCQGLDCRFSTADAEGAFGFDEVPLGRWMATAQSQVTASAGSAAGDLLVEGDVADLRLVLSGLAEVTGVVERDNGSPAAFAQLTLEGYPTSSSVRFADANGAFTFTGIAAQQFTLTAVDPVSTLKGAVGGTLLGGERRTVRVVLQPTARVSGRVFKANGDPAAGISIELAWLVPEARSLFVTTQADGRFVFEAAPLVIYTMSISDPIGPGTAGRSGQLAGDTDLGNIVLDEAPPQVGGLDPVPSSTGVPRAHVIRVTFTEPIRPGTISSASVVLEGPDGDVTSVLEVIDGDRAVTVRPISPLRAESTYTLRVRPAILDRLGKSMVSEYVASFRTEDITAPTWLELSPAPNTGGVSIYSPIRIPFSEPVVPSDLSGAFAMRDGGNAPVPGRLDWILGNSVLVFTPNRPLNEDAAYRVTLGTAVDLAGNRQDTGLDFLFTTTDRTPPQITSLAGGPVIENDIARVAAVVPVTHDIGVVDFYLNGVLAFADRAQPFELVFQAGPQYGAPGAVIEVSAIATDTSGNRGSPVAIDVPVVADQPPAIAVVAPVADAQYANGARVTVNIRGSDDLGVARLAFRAGTGQPQDSSSRAVSPACRDCVESFAFNIPLDLPPGTAIPIEASAVDSKGQTTAATILNVTVIDAVAPTVTITGATTGARVIPGQSATAVVTAQDPGAVASISFTVGGATVLNETRTVTPPQNSVVTSFTFPIPANAQPGQTVTLDAVATDRAGNIGQASRVILPVADRNRPTLILRTADGSQAAVAGRTLSVIATAQDEIGVTTIELNGAGGFTYADARQVSPPSGNPAITFEVPIPASAVPGTAITLQGRAFDLSGNVSLVASLTLTVSDLPDVTLPESVILLAGEATTVTVSVPAGAAAGLRVDLRSANTAVATVTPFVIFNAGETSRQVDVTGVGSGTTAISALILGAERATMTAVVRGGVVRGRVFDTLLNALSGVTVTISGGGPSQSTTSDANGDFLVEGLPGPDVEIRALDPATLRRGYATGSMSRPNGALDINVILVEAGQVAGVVYLPDGTTPAGAGARLDIFDIQNRYTPLGTTFTGESGGYEFPLVSVGSYIVRATDTTGNIGEATVSINATGDDRTVNVVYLGRGQVTVLVRDGSGNPVANALLTFVSNTVFGWSNPIEVTADLDGAFTFVNVPVGSFSVTGRDPATNRAGNASGQIAVNGQDESVTLTVASYGSVQGTVYRPDGTTPVAGAHVVANTIFAATTDAEGRFAFPILPIGFVSLKATDGATNGVGTASTSLSTNGQLRTVDITFVPQGTLIATVVDADGQPVADVPVTAVSGASTSQVSSRSRTDAGGLAVLSHVQAGPFVVHASLGTRSGSTSGTLTAGATQPVTVQLAPTGSITGTLYEPDGVTPARGAVSLFTFYGPYQYWVANATAGLDGRFRFDGIALSVDAPGGAIARPYSVNGNDSAGALRARRTNIELLTNGEVQAADLVFAGLGTVSGRVLNPDSSSAGAITVELRNQHPLLGGTRYATTDAAGFWELRNVPVAPFSVRAGDVSRGLLGEAFGTLSAHGQSVGADIILQLNAVDLPTNRFDGNNFFFDLQPDGAILSGSEAAFRDTPTGLQRGASILEVIANGTPTRFTGSAIGTVEDGGREVATRETGLAGLNVTRKVFVPRDGYFARYLETLANPSDQPVTVDVRVRSHVRGPSVYTCYWSGCGYAIQSSSVITTSSGDAVIDVSNPATADRWVVLDDNVNTDPFVTSNIPALAVVFDGASAPARAAAASFTPGDAGIMEHRWDTLTIPPGGTVSLMHFVVQQTSRAAASLAAFRLSQLAPEALDGLSPEEVGTIANFAVPADGVSAIEPLTSLVGTVTGRVLEGDGVTPVSGAFVGFRSNHPLFGRESGFYAEPDGRFTISQVLSEGGSRMVPTDAYTVWSRFPATNVASPTVAGAFVDGALASERDIVLPTGRAAGFLRRHDGTIVANWWVSIASGQFNTSTSTASDGSFEFRGLRAGSYWLSTTLSNPFGTGIPGGSGALVGVGQTTDASIVLAPTGAVDVAVRHALGQPAVAYSVVLSAGSFQRQRSSDSGGNARFDDVPAGTYQATVTESLTGLETLTIVVVTQDQVSPVTLNLIGVGRVRASVTRPVGPAVASSRVRLSYTRNDIPRTLTVFTGADGVALFTAVPVGPFTVVAENPLRTAVTASGSGTVDAADQQVEVALVLPATAVVTGTIRQPAPSNALVPGMTVTLTSSVVAIGSPTAVSDASGVFRFENIPAGTFTLSTQNLALGLQGTASGQVTTDNETVAANITLINNVVSLPINLFDANGFLYDIPRNGIINNGTSDAYDNGLRLRLARGSVSEFLSPGTTGLVEDGGREVAIRQTNVHGLDVTRKIYVPTGGYMARFLEVLSNPTASPITLDYVELLSNLACCSGPIYVATSSGDTTLAPGDLWVVTDDDNGGNPHPSTDPTLAQVFSGPGAALPATFAQLSGAALTLRWQGLTIPAGGRVILMHFASQHFTQPRSRAVAERLVQLPPEALDGLSGDEIAAIVNFVVPADGSSTLPPVVVPPMGTVSGVIRAHDGTTAVYGTVTLENTDLLFGRRVSVFTNSGAFTANVNAADFVARATTNLVSIPSPVFTGSFAPGALTANTTILFSNTGGVSGSVVSYLGAPVTAANSYVDIDGANSVNLGPGGTFTKLLVVPGTRTVNAFTPPPTGGTWLRGSAPVVVEAGQMTNVVVAIQSTGSVTGFVRRPNGTLVPSASVTLRSTINAFNYSVSTGQDGAFTFPAVPEGTVQLSASDPLSGVSGTAVSTTVVTASATAQQDIVLAPTGTITGTITYPDGSPAVGVRVAASGNISNSEAYTDANGVYTLNWARIGCCISLEVWLPGSAQNSRRYAYLSLAADGEVNTQNFVLPPRVTLRVHVRNAQDQPLSSAIVYGPGSTAAYTNAAGTAEMLYVEGFAGLLRAEHSSVGIVGYASVTVTDADHGRVLEITVRPPIRGTIQGRILAGDGQTGMPASINVYDAIRGNYLNGLYAEDGSYVFADIGANGGRYQLRVTPNASYVDGITENGTFAAGETVTRDITVPASVITGTVRYADGTPVSQPNVFARGLTPYGSIETFYASRTDQDGNYAIFGVGVGPVSVLAQDNAGLVGLGSETIVDVATPVVVDVTMLPTGTVQGVVTNAGVVVPYAWVSLRPDVDGMSTREAQTNENGAFEFTGVPALGFTVSTCYEQRCAEVAATLTTEGQVLSINLPIPATASVSGVLRDTDRVTPVANQDVYVTHASGNQWGATTGADGRFEITGLPDGNVWVTATRDPNAAALRVSLLAGHTVDLILRLNMAVTDEETLTGDDGFRYDFDCRGRLMNGGQATGDVTAYDYAYRLRVDNDSFDCGLIRLGGYDEGEGFTIGPQLEGGGGEGSASFEVTRRVYVPVSGRFARYLDIVRNITSYPLTIEVRVDGRVASSETPQLAVAPNATGSTYAVTTGGSDSLTVAHVFAGAGGLTPDAYFYGGDSVSSYTWTVTLQPGETKAFMHFTAQHDWDDVAGATSLAEGLATLSDPEAVLELDARERGQIVNFVIPGGVTVPVGAISGQVVTAAGAPVAGALVYAIDDQTGLILAQIMTGPDGTYSFTGLSGFEGIALRALSPDDPLVEATAFVVVETNGQVISGVTLQFEP